MTLRAMLHRTGGVTRVSRIRDAGFTRYQVAQGVAAGTVIRPRKGWVALPDADPQLVFAARHGVLLTCVTQATRLGLWTVGDPPPHLAVRTPHSHVEVEGATVHWSQPLIERGPFSLVDPLENVLVNVARCQPWETALAILDSALNKRMVTAAGLSTLQLPPRLRDLIEASSPFADSGLETLFRTRLGWMRQPIRPQVWLLGHRVDFLIGRRLVVQIDGGHHVGEQRTTDNRHDAQLQLAGYHVIRVSYAQVMHCWEEVHELITAAVARGLHE